MNDPRMSYYSRVYDFSNIYASQLGLVGSYGHEFKNMKIPELVHHDGCIFRDGIRGGSEDDIYWR